MNRQQMDVMKILAEKVLNGDSGEDANSLAEAVLKFYNNEYPTAPLPTPNLPKKNSGPYKRTSAREYKKK